MLFHEPDEQFPILTIRPCQAEDIPHVVDLTRYWETEQITVGFKAIHADILTMKLGPFFLLAVQEKEIVGFVLATRQEIAAGMMSIFPDGGRYLEIEALYLLPLYRNRGIGTILMKAIMQTANDHAVEHFSVSSMARNWVSVASFYERLGFDTWLVRMFQ